MGPSSLSNSRNRDSSEEEEEELIPHSLTLSIVCGNGRLGAAFFEKESLTLFLFEDSPLQGLGNEFSTGMLNSASDQSTSEGSVSNGRLNENEAKDLAGMRE